MHHGGRGQSFVYELAYDGKGKDGSPFLLNLLDVEGRAEPPPTPAIASLPALESELPVPYRGQTGPVPGGERGALRRESPHEEREIVMRGAESGRSVDPGPPAAPPSYPEPSGSEVPWTAGA